MQPVPLVSKDLDQDDTAGKIPFDNLRVNALSLPISFSLAALFHALTFLNLIGWYFISVPIHEMGHTLVAWMGSRFALPLGAFIPMAGFSVVRYDRSLSVFILVCAVVSYLGLKALRAQRIATLALLAVFFTLTVRLSWFMPADQWQMWMIYGGVGGEFVLATVLIIGFYYNFSSTIRWDFFRFPFLFAGCFSLVSSVLMWKDIAHGQGGLPIGTFMEGKGDASGDMDLLQSSFGWSPQKIISSYDHLGRICLLIVTAHFVFFLWKTYRSTRQAA